MERASDQISEGLSSNFFAVLKNGSVQTAPLQMVLPGTVQQVVLDFCKRMEIPVKFEVLPHRFCFFLRSPSIAVSVLHSPDVMTGKELFLRVPLV